jgi:hypothetical protein
LAIAAEADPTGPMMPGWRSADGRGSGQHGAASEEATMSDEVRFDRGEMDRLTAIALEARDALVDRVTAEFSDDQAAEALCFTLAILAAFGFVPDEVEQQHDMAMAINQAVSRAPFPILWRMAPAAG